MQEPNVGEWIMRCPCSVVNRKHNGVRLDDEDFFEFPRVLPHTERLPLWQFLSRAASSILTFYGSHLRVHPWQMTLSGDS